MTPPQVVSPQKAPTPQPSPVVTKPASTQNATEKIGVVNPVISQHSASSLLTSKSLEQSLNKPNLDLANHITSQSSQQNQHNLGKMYGIHLENVARTQTV